MACMPSSARTEVDLPFSCEQYRVEINHDTKLPSEEIMRHEGAVVDRTYIDQVRLELKREMN